MSARKEQILAALYGFVAQRSGMDYRNYGDVKTYRAEQRSITKDRHHAEQLLAYVARRDSITADDILKAADGAFSGRLAIKLDGEKVRIDYCTGQYFPTEYRRAVCAVAASAIRGRIRADMPKADATPANGIEHHGAGTYNGMTAGDYIRTQARRELGASLASRWFN